MTSFASVWALAVVFCLAALKGATSASSNASPVVGILSLPIDQCDSMTARRIAMGLSTPVPSAGNESASCFTWFYTKVCDELAACCVTTMGFHSRMSYASVVADGDCLLKLLSYSEFPMQMCIMCVYDTVCACLRACL